MLSLSAESLELGLPGYVPERGPDGRRLHLGRGHMSLLGRRVRAALNLPLRAALAVLA